MKMCNIVKGNVIYILVIILIGCNKPAEDNSRITHLPYYEDPSFTPVWLDPTDARVSGLHTIRPFKLTNQDGKEITEKSLDGKIYISDFFFTSCPGICPKMTANMNILQETFLKDDSVILLSHSVTPEKDSVDVLKEYAKNNDVISGKWHLLTGNRQEIYSLGRQFYFVEEDLGEPKGVDDFLHTENFVLVDKSRHIRGIYNGLNTASINQLIVDVNTLKNEM